MYFNCVHIYGHVYVRAPTNAQKYEWSTKVARGVHVPPHTIQFIKRHVVTTCPPYYEKARTRDVELW